MQILSLLHGMLRVVLDGDLLQMKMIILVIDLNHLLLYQMVQMVVVHGQDLDGMALTYLHMIQDH